MFFPEKMEKMNLIFLDKDRDRIVDKLGEIGCAHIIESGEKYKLDDGIGILLFRIEKLIDILEHLQKKELSFLRRIGAVYVGREVKKSDVEKFEKKANILLEKIEDRIKYLDEKRNNVAKEINEIERKLDIFKIVKNLGISVIEGKYFSVCIGEMPIERFEFILKNIPKNAVIINHIPHGEKEIIAFSCLKSSEAIVKRFLISNGFEEYKLDFNGDVGKWVRKLEKRLRMLRNEKCKIEKRLKSISETWLEELKFLEKVGKIAKKRVDIISRLSKTKHTYFVEAWVPSRDVNRLKNGINMIKSIIIRFKKPKKGEEPPVMLKNPIIIRPFERIVKLYSIPKYNEIDPTFLLALIFPLFFAICLTDAGYGLILLTLSCLGYTLFRKLENNAVKDILLISLICSIPTIILGIITGSIFGGLIQGVLKGFGIKIPIFFDLFKKAKIALGFAIGIGWIHIFFGFLIKGFIELRKKNKINTVRSINLGVMEFLIGLMLFYLLKYITLSRNMLFLILGIFIVNMIVMLYLDGPSGIMNISGILSNVLSYARLFALAMSTTAIALIVNGIAAIFSSLFNGIITFIILVFGHFFSFGLNAFGGFIHSLRLHYVEFFTKIYKGDGIEFKPFTLKINTWR